MNITITFVRYSFDNKINISKHYNVLTKQCADLNYDSLAFFMATMSATVIAFP